MRPITQSDTTHIVANALRAARRSILSDLALFLLVDDHDEDWRLLVNGASNVVYEALKSAMDKAADSLRPELDEDDDEPPSALVEAIAEYCATPRFGEDVVKEIGYYVRCRKTRVRDLLRTMEQRGVLVNTGTAWRHQWIAASSARGAPRPNPD